MAAIDGGPPARHRVSRMSKLILTVLSLRYSSWSMRPWLVLYHTGAPFETETVALPHMARQSETTSLAQRRALGSVRGLFPVLRVDGTPIHESLAICEYVADAFPQAQLWPAEPLQRAAARAICAEMVSGFNAMRNELSCHLFGRVPSFTPSAAARDDIERVFEIWTEKLRASGGPFLFGRFTIADAMYFPVLTRFRTYGVALPSDLEHYAAALEAHPSVRALVAVAATAPRLAVYDDYLRSVGGDPDAALRSHGAGR
jgi:glutathione S-transferase